MSETKPQVVDTVPESYVRTSGLQFIDGVLHQLFVSGHTGGEGVWVAVPGQDAIADEGEPVSPSAGGTEAAAPAAQSPSPLPDMSAPVAPPVPAPTDPATQSQVQEG